MAVSPRLRDSRRPNLNDFSCAVLWQRHIEAGDLGSHIYNAWLAQLIHQGHAPGLYLAHQSHNVLLDVQLLTARPSLVRPRLR